MTSVGTVISAPTPAYSNPPIQPQFFEPSRFQISDITRGTRTTITTVDDMNYVVGQQVRLLIPQIYGSYQLNNLQGYVLEIPTSNSVVVSIDSLYANAFIPEPFTADITNIVIDSGTQLTITANNSFRREVVQFTGVGGMTEINLLTAQILSSSPTSFSVFISTTGFSAYSSGGVATLYNVPQTQAQIIAIGDVNSGIISLNGRVIPTTNVPGSFINIS